MLGVLTQGGVLHNETCSVLCDVTSIPKSVYCGGVVKQRRGAVGKGRQLFYFHLKFLDLQEVL